MRSDATWRLKRVCPFVHTDVVQRARRHHRLFSALAFALLALIAELLGRSLAHRLDVGRHVSSPSYSSADYYPFLLAGVKLAVALLLARLAWRFVRARAAARAGRRVLAALGNEPQPAPRVRLELSPRLWLAAFVVTSVFALVHVDADRAAARAAVESRFSSTAQALRPRLREPSASRNRVARGPAQTPAGSVSASAC